MSHAEVYYVHRVGWLRAAVLGANDGIISTASLIVGVAAAAGDRGAILTAAFAGWAAGAIGADLSWKRCGPGLTRINENRAANGNPACRGKSLTLSSVET